jgi:DNA (cytosine-5)-methyltransferase 1
MKLRVASLFSGAGGLDLGFVNAGHDVVWANDHDGDSCLTYRRNIGEHIEHADVREVDPNGVPDHDILIGGFPCQGFSRANIHRVEQDERNSLYVHVIRFLKFKQPKFFMLENVRGILTLNGGKDFQEIQAALAECGYDVQHKVLNAAHYGVPQSRIRVILVGIRRDVTDQYEYEYPRPTHSANTRDGLKPLVTIAEALRDISEPTEGYNLPNHIYSAYKITNRDFTGHRATDPNKPSPTILARGNGGGGVCAIQHPLNHRRLSVRESATIQTFPLDFVFEGKLMSGYRQVGNAVPVLLGQQVAMGFRKK